MFVVRGSSARARDFHVECSPSLPLCCLVLFRPFISSCTYCKGNQTIDTCRKVAIPGTVHTTAAIERTPCRKLALQFHLAVPYQVARLLRCVPGGGAELYMVYMDSAHGELVGLLKVRFFRWSLPAFL